MALTEHELKLQNDAVAWVKANKNVLTEKFASLKQYPSVEKPFTIFMAGSPGAGKTEFSLTFIKSLLQDPLHSNIVRIDADEIRKEIPGYTGNNSAVIHPAAIIGVEKIFDHVQKHFQYAVVDGTFAHFKPSFGAVERALGRNRKVGIVYIYQDPIVAWNFTQAREKLEGRNIPKEAFVEAFFTAKENVNETKRLLGQRVNLDVVIKNFENKVEKTHFNVDNVDSYLKNEYNSTSLIKKLT